MNKARDTDLLERSFNPTAREDRPLVTFALFAYNQENFIREAIEGAFSQTYSPLEIILSDDCSSDRTFQIMEEMAKAYRGPHQVKVRRQTVNDGVLNHVCAVIPETNGEIVVLAAGDDVSLPERVETVVAAWTSECLGLFSACDLINEYGETIERGWATAKGARERLPWLKEFRSDLFVYGASSCYHRSILEKLPSSQSKVYSEDTPLNLLIQLNSGEIRFCPKSLVKYRVHGSTISNINLPSRPSLSELVREEKGRAKQIKVQKDILVYLRDVLVPSADANNWMDLSVLQDEIDFCDLRLNWYTGGLIPHVRIMPEIRGRSWLWVLPRLFGLRFYVILKYLSVRMVLGKRQGEGVK